LRPSMMRSRNLCLLVLGPASSFWPSGISMIVPGKQELCHLSTAVGTARSRRRSGSMVRSLAASVSCGFAESRPTLPGTSSCRGDVHHPGARDAPAEGKRGAAYPEAPSPSCDRDSVFAFPCRSVHPPVRGGVNNGRSMNSRGNLDWHAPC
jgi:hypothetical protein